MTLDNIAQLQSTEAPVEKEKQQLVFEDGSDEKQKKEGVEEILFVESVKRAKTEWLLQTTTAAAAITTTTTTIDKENKMADEIHFPSVPIVCRI